MSSIYPENCVQPDDLWECSCPSVMPRVTLCPQELLMVPTRVFLEEDGWSRNMNIPNMSVCLFLRVRGF